MNFLEAREANRKHKVKMRCQDGWSSLVWDVAQLRTHREWSDEALDGQWDIYEGPKIVEFECKWDRKEFLLDNIPMDVIFPDGFKDIHKILPQLIGKKWRVKCEEIL